MAISSPTLAPKIERTVRWDHLVEVERKEFGIGRMNTVMSEFGSGVEEDVSNGFDLSLGKEGKRESQTSVRSFDGRTRDSQLGTAPSVER